MKKIYWVIIIIIIIILSIPFFYALLYSYGVFAPYGYISNEGATVVLPVPEQQETIETAIITRIIDGDTYELENGERVRVLGIDCPEITEDGIKKWTNRGINETRVIDCYHEGIKYLEDWILNKEVNLTTDENEQDRNKYDRLLRYVSKDGNDVGERLISEGYAIMYDPTSPRFNKWFPYLYLQAQMERMTSGCLWKD